jgi:hypothetical protein
MSEKVVVHEGKRYRTVERNAKIGDKILTINYYGYDDSGIKDGDILTCTEAEYRDGSIAVNVEDGFFDTAQGDSYLVLEPLDSGECCEEPTVDTTQASPQVIDMLANLARRVTQLESQLRATQRNLETFAEQTESNSEDIRTLDERTQVIDAIMKFYGRSGRL